MLKLIPKKYIDLLQRYQGRVTELVNFNTFNFEKVGDLELFREFLGHTSFELKCLRKFQHEETCCFEEEGGGAKEWLARLELIHYFVILSRYGFFDSQQGKDLCEARLKTVRYGLSDPKELNLLRRRDAFIAILTAYAKTIL